jgi:hypothetical protein
MWGGLTRGSAATSSSRTSSLVDEQTPQQQLQQLLLLPVPLWPLLLTSHNLSMRSIKHRDQCLASNIVTSTWHQTS